MNVAVVIPAYNESKHIRSVLQRLQRCETDHVITPIVVDDGSTDGTHEKARVIDGVRVLRHRINLGKGAAAKTGCDAAYKTGADIIVLMDADGQHHPEDIARVVAPLTAWRKVHIVIGARAINSRMPFLMRCGNLALSSASRVLFNIRVRDTQSGFRAFDRDVYPLIRWDTANYAMETEMLILGAKRGLNVLEVKIETVYHDSYKGTTIFDGLRILQTLLRWKLPWYREFKSSESFLG